MTTEKETPQSLGGQARAEALSAKERKEIASQAAKARWTAGLPKSTHEGEFLIGDLVIPCAVLEGGTRVLTQKGFLRALGRSPSPRGMEGGGDQLPAFLRAKSLSPFISEDLRSATEPIVFVHRSGLKSHGFKAELLPLVCDVYLRAREAAVLAPNQFAVARQCEMLVRSLAKVGIAALVDEATGYQEVRDRRALQALLDKYLMQEFAAWAKRFPDEFYQQIFRLRNWEWKGMRVNRPQALGHYTNDIVYERLAPGLLEELKRRNPIQESGARKAKHHQFLTDEVGHPALAQHLHSAITLMKISDTWAQFMRHIDRALPKRGDTLELDLPISVGQY
jgi:hypothetical protein